MRVFPDQKTHYFDVDDTLILWGSENDRLSPYKAKYEDYDDTGPSYKPNYALIRELKAAHMRGHYVVVWSAGGSDWAATIVNELELAPYVDEVRSKPDWIWDDKQPEEWTRVIICSKK